MDGPRATFSSTLIDSKVPTADVLTFKYVYRETPPDGSQLRLPASNAEGGGSIPGQGTPVVKNLPVKQETQVRSLHWADLLEEE